MTRLLYINASPRSDSVSDRGANLFLNALKDNVITQRIDLFQTDLPEVTDELTSAKTKFITGMDLSPEEESQWASVMNMVEQLKAADYYLIAVPMWNFGLPYKLKHYIDLVNHPSLTFTRDEAGPRGLVKGRATVIYSRGGDYSSKDNEPDPLDFQSTYFNAWLSSIGIFPITEILLQNTMLGPTAIKEALDAAEERLENLARDL